MCRVNRASYRSGSDSDLDRSVLHRQRARADALAPHIERLVDTGFSYAASRRALLYYLAYFDFY